jgi:hypothetical protein
VIDPVTAFGVAVTAFNTVQKLVKAGKEIESVAGQLGKWYSAVQSFNESAAKKEQDLKKGKFLGKGSIEQEALDIVMHRERLKKMEYELYILIAGVYGQEAYKSMMAERTKIKRQREQAAKIAKRRKQEIIANGLYLFAIAFLLVLCYHMYEYLARNL